MRISSDKTRRGFLILSWALYDLANQFFVLNIISLYFVRWLVLEKGVPEILYSISFGISIFFVALLAPFLGFISDLTRRYKGFLTCFTLLSVIFTIFLSLSESILLALIFFAIANFGCQIAVVFYNALMVDIAPKERLGLISGLGRMFAYLGAVLSLYFVKPLVLEYGYKSAFLPAALFFLIFSLPCIILIKDKYSKQAIGLIQFFKRDSISKAFKTIRTSFSQTYKIPGASDFLKSAFFGLAAINVIILFMSVYASQVFRLNESQMINLVAFGAFFAIIGSIISGAISDYIGYRRCLISVFILWIFCFLAGAIAKSPGFFFFVGAAVGLAMGATSVVARALAISLVPKDRIGAVFGLFNFVGYISSILGALFWGLMLLLLSPLGEIGYRLALFSLNIFIFLGIFFILRIPKTRKNIG
ncbi:MAG: MFS transporter [Candidatus Omnitrophica bacterium]|nr:MFS transporter [Candidatus Omnitrophota bacterium]